MRNKNTLAALAILAAGFAVFATGCGKARDTSLTGNQPAATAVSEAPIQVVTEKPTEKVTEKVTEKPTEKVTEVQTEAETEPETVAATEATPAEPAAPAEVPEPMSPEEELAQEQTFEGNETKWAADDLNVRATPDTSADNIMASYAKGDKITVVGRTPAWYKVYRADEDLYGYVSAKYVSDTEVAPKTDEEKAAEEAGQGAEADNSAEAAQAAAQTAQEAGVSSYAESYPIRLAADANFRSAPGENSEVLGTISAGTEVTAVGETDRWYQVEYNGQVGYVNKNLIA